MTDKQIRDRIVGALSVSMMPMEMELECVRFLDRCLEVPKWIPVTERLPESGANVLVCVTDRIDNVKLEKAYLLAQYCVEDGWILEMWPDIETPNVTHWMPLPKPPKEE